MQPGFPNIAEMYLARKNHKQTSPKETDAA
jgi:hypothetical protein